MHMVHFVELMEILRFILIIFISSILHHEKQNYICRKNESYNSIMSDYPIYYTITNGLPSKVL